MNDGNTPNARSQRKIFVVSLHRMVTRSTDMLLSMLGYHTIHYPKFHQGKNLQDAVRGLHTQPERVVDVMTPLIEEFDAVSDVPFPTLYRQLDERWPESRFILVQRDPDAWVKGVRGMLRDRKLSPFNRIQYAPYIGSEHETILDITDEQLHEMQRAHHDNVRRYFHEEVGAPDRLCMVHVRDPDAGARICEFLGHEPMPLPRISGKDPEGELVTARAWAEIRPDNPDAHYLLGKNLYALGQHEAARAALERSLALSPKYAKSHLYLYRVHNDAGASRAASDHAAMAIALGMRNKPNLYLKAGLGRLRRGRLIRGFGYLLQWIHREIVPYK